MPKVSEHEKGTPEYFADLASWRARMEAKKAAGEPQKPLEATEPAEEIWDLGTPEEARMERPVKPEKASGKRGRPRKLSKDEMLKVEDVHRHVKWPLEMLSKIEGHEHWRRDDDEIATIAEPATRILNRHPEWVDVIRAGGDPAALIFACVMVLGPSVMEEINRVRGQQRHPQPAQRPAQRPAQQQPAARTQEPAGGGFERNGFPGPAEVSGSAAAVIAPPPDLPTQHF